MTDPASTATQVLPGTKFFAPQARLVKPDGSPLAIGDQSINQDVMSVTVTQPCNGVGQVEVTLNNQRFDGNRPASPVWRFNKLGDVTFGSRFRVDIRYGQDGWTPLMLARITDISFAFPSAAGGSLTLKAEDLLSILKNKPAHPVLHNPQHEIDMVEGEVAFSGSGLTVVPPEPRQLFSTPLPETTHQPDKSYLQFIQSLAERMDYELYVEFDDPGAPLAGSTAQALMPKLYFGPARSSTLGDPIPLAWGLDIIEFKPAIKVWELNTSATAAGNVPRGRGSITVEVQMADAIAGDLHAAPGQPAPLTALEFRQRAIATESSQLNGMQGDDLDKNVKTLEAANIDEERARMQAMAALRKSAREFLTAEVTTIGYPRLRPGVHVNLTGFYPPFDGVYYVTQAVHTLSSAGYTTKINVRRPGMLDPAGYPGG
ncbi:MAG: phage late control D family protein [Hyphomicrobium sp.]